jgi:serine/threonine-protein kinase
MKIPVKEGDVIQGAYRVERVIGMGGMAVVVAAIDLKSNQRVAVKVLLKKAARSEEVVKRFQREQRTISRLSSEHVTRMLGAGIHGSSPYMAMEYLEGQDLSDVLKSRGPLQVSEAVDYVLQAMEAIAEAHSIGVIHRDLKPGNMFLAKGPDGSPFVKVLDFGISKASGAHQSEESSLTQT